MKYEVVDGSIVVDKVTYKPGEVIPSGALSPGEARDLLDAKIIKVAKSKVKKQPATRVKIKIKATQSLAEMPIGQLRMVKRDDLMFAIAEQYGIPIADIRKTKQEDLVEFVMRKRGM